MDDVLEAARRLIADNYGRTSDILRFARALLAAEKAVKVARAEALEEALRELLCVRCASIVQNLKRKT